MLYKEWWRVIGNAEHHDDETSPLARPPEAAPASGSFDSPAAGASAHRESPARQAEAAARRLGPGVDWPLD